MSEAIVKQIAALKALGVKSLVMDEKKLWELRSFFRTQPREVVPDDRPIEQVRAEARPIGTVEIDGIVITPDKLTGIAARIKPIGDVQ